MEGSQGTTPALCASLRPCHAVSAAAQLASGQPPLTPPPSTLLTTFQHSARLFQAAIQCSERLWSMVRCGILRTATVSSESSQQNIQPCMACRVCSERSPPSSHSFMRHAIHARSPCMPFMAHARPRPHDCPLRSPRVSHD